MVTRQVMKADKVSPQRKLQCWWARGMFDFDSLNPVRSYRHVWYHIV